MHIQSCVVKWSQEGQTLTEPIDKGLSQANISIGPKKWNVTVQAVLNMGFSISARITIPAKDDFGEVFPHFMRIFLNENEAKMDFFKKYFCRFLFSLYVA